MSLCRLIVGRSASTNALMSRMATSNSIRFSSTEHGQGDGAGGTIRQSGGAWGKREQAQEDQYFRRQQQEQLQKLKEVVKDEISNYEQKIKDAEAEIQEAKRRMEELKKLHPDLH